MTIQEVANKLSKCALVNCEDCKHFIEYSTIAQKICKSNLIQEMAEECRKIAVHMEDDGK